MALPPRFRRPRFLILAAAIVVLTAAPAGLYLARRPAPPARRSPFSEFIQRVESGSRRRGDVRRARDRRDVPRRLARARPSRRLSSSRPTRRSSPTWSAARFASRSTPADGSDLAQLERHGVSAAPSSRCSASPSTAPPPARFRRSARAPALADRTANVVTFQDVAGVDEAKDEVKEIVDFLREPDAVLRRRRPHSEGRAARRPSGHRQDAARALDRRRSGRAVPVRQRIRFRRDVRRRRRRARPQAVPRCAPPRVLHHLHRRARRRRPQPRRQLAQPRGARADAQPAARRDGRLRRPPGHRRHRRHQPPGHPRSGAAAARAGSIGR